MSCHRSPNPTLFTCHHTTQILYIQIFKWNAQNYHSKIYRILITCAQVHCMVSGKKCWIRCAITAHILSEYIQYTIQDIYVINFNRNKHNEVAAKLQTNIRYCREFAQLKHLRKSHAGIFWLDESRSTYIHTYTYLLHYGKLKHNYFSIFRMPAALYKIKLIYKECVICFREIPGVFNLLKCSSRLSHLLIKCE